MRGELPAGFERRDRAGRRGGAGRPRSRWRRARVSQAVAQRARPALPELLGGSADLTGSNNTKHKGATADSRATTPAGNYLHYGVREFGMTAIMNGIALHGGFVPFGGTFLVFSDYARNAAAHGGADGARGSILVLTHDSIGLGEDGPTHQPVEHVAVAQVIPRMDVWRPCDTVETGVAWAAAIGRRTAPTMLVLTRQALPPQPRDAAQLAAIARGGYVLVDGGGTPRLHPDRDRLRGRARGRGRAHARQTAGGACRVVSMPCTSVFDAQDAAWRDSGAAARRRVPASRSRPACTDGWWRYVGSRGRVIGMTSFGASAPAQGSVRAFRLHGRCRRRGSGVDC